MAGKKGQKKRFSSDEEKVSICAQTCAPGVSVAQVARRYAMNTNLIHKWLRDPKFATDSESIEGEVLSCLAFFPLRLLTTPRPKTRPRRLTPSPHEMLLRSISQAVIS